MAPTKGPSELDLATRQSMFSSFLYTRGIQSWRKVRRHASKPPNIRTSIVPLCYVFFMPFVDIASFSLTSWLELLLSDLGAAWTLARENVRISTWHSDFIVNKPLSDCFRIYSFWKSCRVRILGRVNLRLTRGYRWASKPFRPKEAGQDQSTMLRCLCSA